MRLPRWMAIGAVAAALSVAGCTSNTTAPGQTTGAAAETDSSQTPEEVPVPVVARRDFQIAYQLDGATEASLQVPISPPVGMVWVSYADAGTEVSAGDRIGQWDVNPSYRAALAVSAKTSRVDAARLAHLGDAPNTVNAPIAGMVHVAESDDVSVAAPGMDVVVPITGIQQLRLSSVSIDASASVETVVGQRTIPCVDVWIGNAPSDAEGVDASGSLRCRLPQIVETAPQLRATLHVTSQAIKDSIVVPDVMLGQDATGYVVTVIEDGKKTTVPVEVGPSDGVVRVITSKIPLGAMIVPPSQ